MGKLLGLSLKLKIILSVVAVGIVAAAAAVIISVMNKEELFRVLKLFDLNGTAVVDRTDTGRFGAYIGMNLQGGDTFSVEKESNAVISLDSDKYMFLDSETVIDLVAKGSENDSLTAITLLSGSILNEITTPLSANSSYEIYTPKASMAVRGTEFHVKSQMNGNICAVDLDVLHGRVEVNIYDENGNVKHGPVYVGENKKVTLITEPGLKGSVNADDAETYFAIRNGDEFTIVGNGEDPVYETDFTLMSAEAKKFAIKNNNNGSLVLDSLVMKKLMGINEEAPAAETEEINTEDTTVPYSTVTPAPTTVSESFDEETTYPVYYGTSGYSENSVTKASYETGAAAETTVPYTNQTVSEPEASITSASHTEPPITTVVINETTVSSTSKTTVSAAATEKTTTKKTTSTETDATTETTATTSGTAVPPNEINPESDPDGKCSVSFYVDDELYKVITVKKGGTITEIPTVPKKTGYVGVWKVDGEMFDSSAPVNKDMKVTAVYDAKEFTVKFVPGAYVSGSEYYGIVTVKYGECVALADFPVIDWIPEETVWQCGGVLFDHTTPVYEDMIVSLYPAQSIEYALYTFSTAHPEDGCEEFDLGDDCYMDRFESIISMLAAKAGAPTSSEKYYLINGMSIVPITSNDNTPSSLGVSSASLLTFYKGPLAVLDYGTGMAKVPANAKIISYLPALLEGKDWYCGEVRIDSSVTPTSLGWNGKDVLHFNMDDSVAVNLNIYYPTSDEGNIAAQQYTYTLRNSYTIHTGETLPVSLSSLINAAQNECDKYAAIDSSSDHIGYRAEGFCIKKDGEVVQDLSASTVFTKDMAYNTSTGYNIDLYADIAQHIYGVNFMRFRGSYIEMPGTIPYYVAYNAKLRSTLDGMISDTAYTWYFVNGSSYKELSSTDTIESLGLMDETSDLMFYYGLLTELNYPGGSVKILPDANILDHLPASASGWKIAFGADYITVTSTLTPLSLSDTSSEFINSITVTQAT